MSLPVSFNCAKVKNQNFVLPTPVDFLKRLFQVSYLQIYLTIDSSETLIFAQNKSQSLCKHKQKPLTSICPNN